MALSLAINGAAGRMGRRLVALAHADAEWRVAAAIDSASSVLLGRDAGEVAGVGPIGVVLASDCGVDFDVMVDFSLPAGTMRAVEQCLARKRPLVIGTTGHSAEQRERIAAAATAFAVLQSPNMSVGVNVLLRVLGEVARALGPAYDIEISETHHRNKADAPSGTALAMLAALNSPAKAEVVHGRHGALGQRPTGEIGMHALRMGDVVGEHTVFFGGPGETIRISHQALSRDTFAGGALRAAKWIVDKPAGIYAMGNLMDD